MRTERERGGTTAHGGDCSSVGEFAVSKEDFSIFNVSTNDIPENERVPLLREFYWRGVLKAEVDATDGRPFAASFTSHALPDAQLVIGGLFGAKVIRTKQLVV